MKKITLQCIALLFVMSSWGQTVFINEDFEDTDISGGAEILATGVPRYNYTADIAGGQENWASSPSVTDKTNSVSINGTSSGATYAADAIGGQQALGTRGSANYGNANGGIYFTGLDLTGQSSLYFEFEIYGGDPTLAGNAANLSATLESWKINLNHGNSSTNFDITDSYFGATANVTQNIPFDITNGTTNPTNQTSFDIITGQWIKISGTVDLTGKTLGSFGALQINTDTGGFLTATGGYLIFAIDNVYVATSAPALSNDSFELTDALKIYPNPVNNVLKIKSKNNLDVSNLSLVNVIGKTVYSTKSLQDIDVSNFAKGLYILKITSKEQGVLSKKVIIE